jgi:DNA-binding CsgD family transcriptional regulator
MGMAIFVLNEQGAVLYLNAFARDWLRRDGRVLWRDGGLAFEQEACAERFGQILREVALPVAEPPDNPTSASAELGVFQLPPRQGREPMLVHVVPMRSAITPSPGRNQCFVVLVREQGVPRVSSAALKTLFGLTNKESEVAAALALGQSLEEIAASLGVGLGTVRTHLKSCLTKTGTSRQAQLVSRILHMH